MVLEEDRGGDGQGPVDTGLPRVRTSEDLPRWLVILGMVAGLTLLVALLRYAVDLLGVVFLIIVVGFSIRAFSDWLTEGESVSGWALAAVAGGLCGTLAVALWLFGSHDRTLGVLERRLPQPVMTAVEWLEDHGWGQRVLLGSSGVSSASASPSGVDRAVAGPATPGASGALRPPGDASAREVGPPRMPGSSGTARPGSGQPRSEPGVAEAATVRPAAKRGRTRSPAPAAAGNPDEVAPAEPAPVAVAPVDTSMVLKSSQASALVGTAVRLTATVSTSAGSDVAAGMVEFFRGDSSLGRVPVRRAGDGTSVATLTTLALPIGTHELKAEFHGASGFGDCQSASIVQVVKRH